MGFRHCPLDSDNSWEQASTGQAAPFSSDLSPVLDSSSTSPALGKTLRVLSARAFFTSGGCFIPHTFCSPLAFRHRQTYRPALARISALLVELFMSEEGSIVTKLNPQHATLFWFFECDPSPLVPEAASRLESMAVLSIFLVGRGRQEGNVSRSDTTDSWRLRPEEAADEHLY